MNQLRRQMVELCRDVASLDDPKTRALAARASQLLPRIEPKPSKAKKANRVRRAEKLDRQRAEMAELHREVSARANGKGELCHEPFTPYDPLELCHLDGGFGRRRENQSKDNCLGEHHLCHRSLDSTPLEHLDKVRAWAARYGYPLPERFRVLAALRGVEVLPTHRKPDHGTEPAF